MFNKNQKANTILTVIALALAAAGYASADTLSLITSAAAQQAADSIVWTQVGPDNTLLNAGGSVKTTKGSTAQVALGAANGVIAVACSANPCSWTGSGFTAGQSLVWTSDSGNGGSGPVSVTFASPVGGAGAYIQADGPGVFTAVLQAYNGAGLLGSVSVTSDSSGHAAYIGVHDQSGSNITKVVWSLSHAAQGLTTDFALGTVNIESGAPVVSLSPSSLTFAGETVGATSSPQSVTLKNTGTAVLNIASVAVSGDFISPSKTCGTTLSAGASCTISISFTPKAAGTRSGSLTITGNAGTHTVNLSGTGVAALKVSATSITFPATVVNTTSSARSVTLTNAGTITISITPVTLTGTDPADYTKTQTCGSTLNAGASCTISVSFKPKAIGSRPATLSITNNAGINPQNIALNGAGTALKVSATSIIFPVTTLNTTSSARSVTLTNAGTTTISITPVTLSGTDPADYTKTQTCGSTLNAGASCTISVSFKPKAIGSRPATLSITNTAGSTPQNIALNGTGTALKVSATSLTFPATTVNTTSAAQSVTLTNAGTTTLSITPVTLTGTDPADYSKTQTCGSTLNAGASCTISVSFKPKAIGSRPATLSITNNAGSTPQNIALNGTGK